MSVVRWEDPPPAGHSRRKATKRSEYWREVANVLRANPLRWAVVLEEQRFGDAGGIAGQVKNGHLTAFTPAGAFEATTRTVGDLYRVYARYVGTSESAA